MQAGGQPRCGCKSRCARPAGYGSIAWFRVKNNCHQGLSARIVQHFSAESSIIMAEKKCCQPRLGGHFLAATCLTNFATIGSPACTQTLHISDAPCITHYLSRSSCLGLLAGQWSKRICTKLRGNTQSHTCWAVKKDVLPDSIALRSLHGWLACILNIPAAFPACLRNGHGPASTRIASLCPFAIRTTHLPVP